MKATHPDGVEGDPPAVGLAQATPDGVAQRAADGYGEGEETDDEGALVVGVEVEEHWRGDGRVGGLADPHQAADAHQLRGGGKRGR